MSPIRSGPLGRPCQPASCPLSLRIKRKGGNKRKKEPLIPLSMGASGLESLFFSCLVRCKENNPHAHLSPSTVMLLWSLLKDVPARDKDEFWLIIRWLFSSELQGGEGQSLAERKGEKGGEGSSFLLLFIQRCYFYRISLCDFHFRLSWSN